MPLPRSIIYTGPLGRARSRLSDRERYHGRCCEVAAATTGCRCCRRLRCRRPNTLERLRVRDGTVLFINRCVFAPVDPGERPRENKNAANSLKRSCHFLFRGVLQ